MGDRLGGRRRKGKRPGAVLALEKDLAPCAGVQLGELVQLGAAGCSWVRTGVLRLVTEAGGVAFTRHVAGGGVDAKLEPLAMDVIRERAHVRELVREGKELP